jgi:plasmid replication initiation protein
MRTASAGRAGLSGGVDKFSEILVRFQRAGERASKEEAPAAASSPRVQPGGQLLPDRHPNRDFFIADLVEWAVKDDRHSMEHPMFSLSKKPDRKIRRYEHNGNTLVIAPGAYGLATIWDKDILIYAVSQLTAAVNQDRHDVSPTVRLTAYDLLVSTNRHTGGGDYDQLQKAFERLSGTRITTDIRTNGVRQREGFGIIDSWKIIEKNSADGRMVAIELRLSDWLYNAILGLEVLTISRDYFRLSRGLERRLYELARKHCGHQAKWVVGLDVLYKKSGSNSPLKRFRLEVRNIAKADNLPDYRLRYDANADQVMFYTKDAKKLAASVKSSETSQSDGDSA